MTEPANGLIENPLDRKGGGDKLITNPLDKPGARDNLITNPLDKPGPSHKPDAGSTPPASDPAAGQRAP